MHGSCNAILLVSQAECDVSGSRILQRCISFRQFARITKGITQRGGPSSDAKVDVREVRLRPFLRILLWMLLAICQMLVRRDQSQRKDPRVSLKVGG